MGAGATWLPALQDTPCRAIRTPIGRAAARRVARAIDRAPPYPRGPRSCPPDDAAAVAVYFRLPRTRRVQPVEFALSGCGGMWAPGRALGVAGPGALSRQAPAGWRKYLR